jgi:hypothetical protein
MLVSSGKLLVDEQICSDRFLPTAKVGLGLGGVGGGGSGDPNVFLHIPFSLVEIGLHVKFYSLLGCL